MDSKSKPKPTVTVFKIPDDLDFDDDAAMEAFAQKTLTALALTSPPKK